MSSVSRKTSENERFHEVYTYEQGLSKPTPMQIISGLALSALSVAALFLAKRYRVSGPSEYIVRTGPFIKDIDIRKKAFQLPFQQVKILDMSPLTISIDVEAMSKQRIPFRMPTVWTIGAKNDNDSCLSYAKLLLGNNANNDAVRGIVHGIIQGETRILTADLDLDDLFADRNTFKKTVVDRINFILMEFGLYVYNANIAELHDIDLQNPYFSEQKKRALQKVNSEARVAVADAIKKGDIGEAENDSQTRIAVCEHQKNAVLAENSRNREKSESEKDLGVARAHYKKEYDIALAEAKAAAEIQTFILQKEVQERRAEQQTAERRATELAATNVKMEVLIKESEGKAKAIQIEADAALYAQRTKAAGLLALKEAEAKGLEALVIAAGGPSNLNQYILITGGHLESIAKSQADALHGLQPKINVWHTGSHEKNVGNILTDTFKMGVPLLEGLREQTGYDFLKPFNSKRVDEGNL